MKLCECGCGLEINENNRFIRGHSNRSLDVKEKKKITNLKNCGFDNPSQSKDVKEKKRLSYQKHYGTNNPSQSEEIKNKKICTNEKKYGGHAPYCSKKVQEKGMQTSNKKYGTDYFSQTFQGRLLTREQMKQSIMKNYPGGSRWSPRKGNYEKEVFNELQKYCQYQLLEDQEFLVYSPDRYIQEFNLIIELYEDWHKSNWSINHDIKRQKDLELVGYKLFIIWLKDWKENKEQIISQFKSFISEQIKIN